MAKILAMKTRFHKKFRKMLQRLPKKIQDKFFERLELFADTPFHPILNNHSVEPTYPNWRSINVTGDYRALFEVKVGEIALFMKIGTHSELY